MEEKACKSLSGHSVCSPYQFAASLQIARLKPCQSSTCMSIEYVYEGASECINGGTSAEICVRIPLGTVNQDGKAFGIKRTSSYRLSTPCFSIRMIKPSSSYLHAPLRGGKGPESVRVLCRWPLCPYERYTESWTSLAAVKQVCPHSYC